MAGLVVITYLELAERDPVRAPSRPAPAGFSTRVVRDPGVNREMYRRVGADYQWIDRLPWSDERWASYAARVETHLVELDGRAAGYFELELDSAELGEGRPVRPAARSSTASGSAAMRSPPR